MIRHPIRFSPLSFWANNGVRRYLTPVAWVCLSLISVRLPWLHSAPRPNIIVVLADDMGYSDIGCFGGEIRTPALDRLAREGVRMTRFHNGGMCVVTRVSLLTGQWWPRALPNFEETPLLPEELKERGYRTALVGKWHLKGHPMDRGFDHFFGFLGQGDGEARIVARRSRLQLATGNRLGLRQCHSMAALQDQPACRGHHDRRHRLVARGNCRGCPG